MPGETTPLKQTTRASNGDAGNGNVESESGAPLRNNVFTIGATVLIAFGAFMTISRHVYNYHMIQEEEEEISETKYRPFCKTFIKSDVRILQTSLGEPSQPWTSLECLHETRIDINHYQAPDANLKVNLDQIAHPDRDVPILGFGGAFTEASALNFETLSRKGKDAVIELLFGKSGLGYSLGRVHMNSCDFSIESYSFDDTDGDFQLDDFDTGVQHDVHSGMVDMMLEASSAFREAWDDGQEGDGGLKIYASPWSPPAWMKAPTPYDDENATRSWGMTSSAQPTCLRDGVGPDSEYAAAWALYFSKYLTAYENLGLPLFAVTVQNEPEFPAPWEACSYTPTTQSEFIMNHLGPQLKESHPDVKLFIFDHNKDHAPVWVNDIVNKTNPASEYVDGTAIHWYAGGMDRLLDGAQGTPNMHRVLEDLGDLGVKKDHIVFGSEACHCPSTGYAGGDINVAWDRAERYAHTILADLAAGSNGWVEWNLILDSVGGPNHLQNLCDSTLLAVPHRAADANDSIPETQPFEKSNHKFGRVVGDGRTREELNAIGFNADFLDVGVVVQPLYYYMGHISRHVRPGSRAVMALVDSSDKGQTFRSAGQTVAGGGVNDLARVGIEITAWPCEGSTRQEFKLNTDKQLELFGNDWLGFPTTSCVGKTNDKDFEGVMTTSCNTTLDFAGQFEFVSIFDDDTEGGSGVKIVLANGEENSEEECLVLRELKNQGGAYGPRGGAQVSIGDCNSTRAEWTYFEETGEIVSSYYEEGNICMTTGWPFLQIGAYDTSENGGSASTVVLLNEAKQSANYALRNDEGDVLVTGSIPPHSIQTVLID